MRKRLISSSAAMAMVTTKVVDIYKGPLYDLIDRLPDYFCRHVHIETWSAFNA